MYFTNGIPKLFNASLVLVFIYYNRKQDVVELLVIQIPNYTKSAIVIHVIWNSMAANKRRTF